ncbi:hypothetical protein BSPWISOX_2459 [uncultured Gammaproteobacteria bacterium]|nr:hypothetical protein BSPWISOX_2459 [uncultured Gammaproteobacteria bacterium]
MLSSEVNSPDFICLFSSVWLIKLICVSPCIFNAFDFIGQMLFKDLHSLIYALRVIYNCHQHIHKYQYT